MVSLNVLRIISFEKITKKKKFPQTLILLTKMNFENSLFQDQPDYTVSELQRGLINDLSWLLKESNDYDMIINVGEPPNIKSFRVHTSVLKARSLYFRAILSGGHHFSSKGKNSSVEITQENIKPDLFEVILKYVFAFIRICLPGIVR